MLRKNQQQFNNRMPIQLDKILSDIAEEKVLHPNYPSCEKKQVDDAWIRVGKKNKLSVHEARSIFKVLQKKYEQERVKESSAWKLFSVMDEIHKKQETKPDVKTEEEESDLPMEEDEEYEMLDVQEEEEHHTPAGYAATGPASDSESPNKSHKSNSSTGSPEKDEKPLKTFGTPKSANALRVSVGTNQNVDEKKILNSLPSASSNKYIPSTPSTQATTAAAAAALQKKGITMKKTTPNTPVASTKTALVSVAQKTTPVRSANSLLDVGKNNRIQLPESLKRKLSEDHSPSQQQKRTNLAQAAAASVSTSSKQQQEQQHSNIASSSSSSSQAVTSKTAQIKDEHEEFCPQEQQQPASHGINLITIPANPIRADLTNGVAVGLITNTTRPSSSTAATVASTSTNGFSPRIEDIDFRNDIIFDTGTGNVTNGGGGGLQQSVNRVNHQSTEIINLGNFDNSLPPTFFKNLCNSSRHEALGLYVANVMNRLGTRAAAKLELGILRAIIDVQSDELEQ